MNQLQNWSHTALIVIDPQVDVLSPEGGAWDLFGEQVSKRGTVRNMKQLRDAAEKADVPVFYSRVEVSGKDFESWTPRNGLQTLMGERKLFLQGAGARFLKELEPTPKTIVVAGMVANLCVEAQVRDATDDGFNAVVVGDAIATVSDEAHEATLANFGLLATAVVSTEQVTRALEELAAV